MARSKRTKHIALISKGIGSNADGSAKIKINKDDVLSLTKKEETYYRRLKIIK